MQENTDQNNSEYGHFLGSVTKSKLKYFAELTNVTNWNITGVVLQGITSSVVNKR